MFEGHDRGFTWIPRATSKFLSDDFGNLTEAAKISELGVHEVTDQKNLFCALDQNFSSLYENFLTSSFEIVDMS